MNLINPPTWHKYISHLTLIPGIPNNSLKNDKLSSDWQLCKGNCLIDARGQRSEWTEWLEVMERKQNRISNNLWFQLRSAEEHLWKEPPTLKQFVYIVSVQAAAILLGTHYEQRGPLTVDSYKERSLKTDASLISSQMFQACYGSSIHSEEYWYIHMLKKKCILNLFLISYIFLDTFLLPRSTQNKLNEASNILLQHHFSYTFENPIFIV